MKLSKFIFQEVSIKLLFCGDTRVIHLYRSIYRCIYNFILAVYKINDSEQVSHLN